MHTYTNNYISKYIFTYIYICKLFNIDIYANIVLLFFHKMFGSIIHMILFPKPCDVLYFLKHGIFSFF